MTSALAVLAGAQEHPGQCSVKASSLGFCVEAGHPVLRSSRGVLGPHGFCEVLSRQHAGAVGECTGLSEFLCFLASRELLFHGCSLVSDRMVTMDTPCEPGVYRLFEKAGTILRTVKSFQHRGGAIGCMRKKGEKEREPGPFLRSVIGRSRI